MMRLNPPGYLRFLQTDTYEATYAGGEANVAVSLANYKDDAAFISKVPDNEIGQCAINALRRYGVDTSGMLVVCPIVPSSDEDALHVRIRGQRTEGVVLCEDIVSFSARKRGCTSIDRIQTGELLEIIYRIQSIFDFFPHAK